MTFQHIKAIIRDDPVACEHLCVLLHDIQCGSIPAAARTLITSARGVALAEVNEDGSTKVRPIGILESITRLASGLLVKEAGPAIKSAVGHCEFGFGTSGGSEVLTHTVAAMDESGAFGGERPIVLKGDVSNAFGSLNRHGENGILEAARRLNPALHAYATLLYGTPSTVTYTSQSAGKAVCISAQRGVAQGDPAGPALFALTIAPPLSELRAEVRTPVHAGAGPAPGNALSFFDDITIVTHSERAVSILQSLRNKLQPYGLTLNMKKTHAYQRGGASAALQQSLRDAGLTRPVSAEGMTVGGSAVGTVEYCRAHCARIAHDIVKELDSLTAALRDPVNPITFGKKFPAAQGMMLVTRVAEATRFVFTLRSMPPDTTRQAALAIDAALERLVAALCGFDLAAPPALLDEQMFRDLVHLPQRNGGAGVTGLVGVADAAWTAAVVQALPHLCRHAPDVVQRGLAPPQAGGGGAADAVPHYVAATRDAVASMCAAGQAVADQLQGFNPFAENPLPAAAGAGEKAPERMQQKLSRVLNEHREKQMHERLLALPQHMFPQLRAAAFLSAGGKGGGAWLTATPALKQNQLNDASFRVALCMRLGVPFRDESGPCHYPGCTKQDDAWGLHAASCKGLSGSAQYRHKLVNGQFVQIAQHAGYHVAVEAKYDAHLQRKPDAAAGEASTDGRIDAVVQLEDGTKLFVDATVRHPVHAKSHLERGAAAKAAEVYKRAQVINRYVISEGHLKPFALETLGFIGASASELLGMFARHKAGGNDILYGMIVRYYRARIAVAIQRGNFNMINKWRLRDYNGYRVP